MIHPLHAAFRAASDDRDLEHVVAEMRRDFDNAFSRATVGIADPGELMLGIRVAGAPFALRLERIVSIVQNARITRVRAARGGALGLASFRGALVPVFDWAWFLERDTEAPAKWLAIADRTDPIAFAFQSLDGCWRVPAEARRASSEKVAWISETVQVANEARLVIAAGALADSIRAPRRGA